MEKKKKLKAHTSVIWSVIIVLIIITVVILTTLNEVKTEFVSAKNLRELEKELSIDNNESSFENYFKFAATMPVSMIATIFGLDFDTRVNLINSIDKNGDIYYLDGATNVSEASTGTTTAATTDYSKTNIQVENVDEADSIKTDGKYIYSISENKVIITNAYPAEDLKIVSEIQMSSGAYPVDIILKDDKMVIIGTDDNYKTVTEFYDLSDIKNPRKNKEYKTKEKYYSSRRIEDKLFLFTEETNITKNNILPIYYVNNNIVEMNVSNYRYMKDTDTSSRTTVQVINIDTGETLDYSAYAVNAQNLYMSENNIYLACVKYGNRNNKEINPLSIFGFKGVFGLKNEIEKTYSNYSYNSYAHTTIYKFEIKENKLKVVGKSELEGITLNQFSMDEYEGNLRVTYTNNDDNELIILDNNMKEIGKLDNLAEGEKIYSTRFIGNRAYLVTYKTVDPLFVIDLSNPTMPKVLGELKIPGYSSYLHPYDENTIIGIGMDTEEVIRRDETNKIINVSARLKGMKVAIFDVTDVTNPIQKSSATIGNQGTYSPILSNHKVLLFSKEKQLLAFPIVTTNTNITIKNADNIQTLEENFNSNSNTSGVNGLVVFNITKDELKLKGIIEEEKENKNNSIYYRYRNTIRGLYLEDIIYTVSENEITASKLDTLEKIKNINIKNGGNEND